MSNCVTHKKRDAVAKCKSCGQSICEQCYNDFDLPDGEHVCAECYKEECRKEAAEVRAVRGMVKRELIFIIIGMIVGLIFSIFYIIDAGGADLLSAISIIIYGPFVFGSLITITKRIIGSYRAANEANKGEENSWVWALLSALFVAVILILISPITTIGRIVVRIRDMRRLSDMADSDLSTIASIDNYIAQTTAPSLVEQAADGLEASNAVEISLDSILGEGITIGANGQVLREIRNR